MTIEISLKTVKGLYKVVEEAIIFHKGVNGRLADAVVWNNVVPTKEGGVLCMNTLLEEGNYSQKQRDKLNANLDYWTQNYEALKTQIFYRDSPEISLSEIVSRP